MAWELLPGVDRGFYALALSSDDTYLAVSFWDVMSSVDGENWDLLYTATFIPIRDMTDGSAGYVAVGDEDSALGGSAAYVSTDQGGTWSEVFGTTDWYYRGVSHGPHGYVIAGADNVAFSPMTPLIRVSTDATTWTTVPITTTHATRLFGSDYVGGFYIASGDHGTILTSIDASTWTERRAVQDAPTLRASAYGGGVYVVVGHAGTILRSDDGVTWSEQVSGTSANLLAVTHGSAGFIAVGDGGTILRSTDGATWSEDQSPTSESLRGVVYRDGEYLAVGSNGAVVRFEVPPEPVDLSIPAHRIIEGKIEVLRRGEWVDVTQYASRAEINLGDHTGVGVNPSGTDGVARTASITLKNANGINLAPRDRNSPINLVEVDSETVYDPLLWAGKEIRVWGRAHTIDESYDTGWKCDFHGIIGGDITATGNSVELTVVDLSKRLQTAYLPDPPETPYSGDMEDVMQAILNDHPGTAGITLYFPSGTESDPRPSNESPEWYVEEYAPAEMSVWDALGRLASRRGWYVGYRWHESTEQMQLQLVAPARWKNESSADYRLSWMTDFYAHDLSDSDSQIVNYIEVIWRDPSGAEHTTVRYDQDSIDAYGMRAGRIRDTEEIKDEVAAGHLADAVIEDMSEMRGASAVDMPIIPGLDVFTGIAMDDPRVSSSEDFLGVENVTQIYDFENGRFRTRVSGPNRVVGGLIRWLHLIEKPGGSRTPIRQRPKGHVIVAAHDAGDYWRRIADYMCEGVDDQDVINEALNAGDVVELSEGTFYPLDTVLIGGGKTLKGQGESTSIIAPQSGSFQNLLFVGGADATITDLSIDGNYRDGSGKSDLVAIGVMGDRVTITECTITDVGAAGIISWDTKGLSVTRCDFRNTQSLCVGIQGNTVPVDVNNPDDYGSVGHQITNCLFGSGASSVLGTMVFVSNSSNVVVSNNSFTPDIITSTPIHADHCLGVTIVGNTFDNSSRAVYMLFSSNSVVTGNSFSRCVRPIYIGGSNYITVGQNAITGGPLGAIQPIHSSVFLEGSSNCNIEGNTIIYRGVSGIELASGSNDNSVQGNMVRKREGEDLLSGISINDPINTGNLVANNDLRDSGGFNNQGSGTIQFNNVGA